MRRRSKPRAQCADCGHHKSAHQYRPDPGGAVNLPPQDCRVPGCTCAAYRQPAPYERIRKAR